MILTINERLKPFLSITETLNVFYSLKSLGTKNELKKEVGGYEHVVVFWHIKVVDGDLINAFQQLPRGTVDGDCILSLVFTRFCFNEYALCRL